MIIEVTLDADSDADTDPDEKGRDLYRLRLPSRPARIR